MLTVTLSSGYSVQVEPGTYVVQFYSFGAWHNLCTFPGTEAGYEQAVLVNSHLDDPNSQVICLH